ncbi:hypothetical protein [Georgenia sp. Marseille-Q6866]
MTTTTARAWRCFLVLLPAVALVLGAALWWWSHPRVFTDSGAGLGAVTEVGDARYFGLGNPPRDLEIVAVRPLVVAGSADAAVTGVVCVGGDASRVGIGDSQMVAELCGSVREPAGPVTPADQLLVEVRGASAGTVAVDGVAVTYRDGVRRGTEVLDVDITVGVGLGITIEELVW